MSNGEEKTVRAVVQYKGTVQGVGFRMTAVGQVSGAPVVGWVMNEADGGVRLEAEGKKAVVDAFLSRVRRTLADRIEKESIVYREPLSRESSFSIRY